MFSTNSGYSLEEKLEQLDYAEVGGSDLQLMLTNRTDEMDYSELKDETKMSVACERICEKYYVHSI